MSISLNSIKDACAEALVKASTCYTPDQIAAYQQAFENETEENARWILGMLLENAATAENKKIPLCDDTGIPYVLIEIGESADINVNFALVLDAIEKGIIEGLRQLPGRPMAVKGTDYERITQEEGLYIDSGLLPSAPIRVKKIKGDKIHLTVMMLGGGPEIRSRTYRVFHHHDMTVFTNEVASWAVEMAKVLGCTPCVPAIGVGRTHYEAASLMMDAMVEGKFGKEYESEFEKAITNSVNETNTGPLGIGGKITAIQTFSKIGPQRASGVRIVCLRTGCCVDPRRYTVIL